MSNDTIHSVAAAILAIAAIATPIYADSFGERREALPERALQGFAQDHCDFTTQLDEQSFTQINEIKGPLLIDNSSGWSVEARTGGRPFLCFDTITIDGAPVAVDPNGLNGFDVADSGIPVDQLADHFQRGKTVNRLWFTHLDKDGGYPVVVVLTPDGFLNIGGASPPRLQGAAARLGFIGEPFGPDDFLQHADRLSVTTIDNDTVSLLFEIDSQAGVAVIELSLCPANRSGEL